MKATQRKRGGNKRKAAQSVDPAEAARLQAAIERTGTLSNAGVAQARLPHRKLPHLQNPILHVIVCQLSSVPPLRHRPRSQVLCSAPTGAEGGHTAMCAARQDVQRQGGESQLPVRPGPGPREQPAPRPVAEGRGCDAQARA